MSEYLRHGRFLLAMEVENQFEQDIIQQLPRDYRAVDIGGCDHSLALRIMKDRPDGSVLSVDPFPKHLDVLSMSGMEFLSNPTMDLDAIIFRYSIHLIDEKEDLNLLVEQCLSIVKSIYILGLSPQSRFPWSMSIQHRFESSCKNIDTLPDATTFCIPTTIHLYDFRTLIASRAWSFLQDVPDPEIEDCLKNMESENNIMINLYYTMVQIKR
jgi:hypothetical protein